MDLTVTKYQAYTPRNIDTQQGPLEPQCSSTSYPHIIAVNSSIPMLQGTILPGVTRKSVMELAAHRGYTVEEGDCPVAEAMEADEIFTCGTAVVVQSVGSLTYKVPPAAS